MPRASHRPTVIVAAVLAGLACAGTTATAASLIGGEDIRNASLTGADVRNGSLTGADVRNRSLRGADIARSTIPADRLTKSARSSLRGARGPAGPQGAPGPRGVPGPQGATGPAAFTTIVTRSATTSFTGGDGIIGQMKQATAQCAAGERFVSGGALAPTATVGGVANFVTTGQAPVIADGTLASQGETPTGWKVTVVRNDDLLGLVTAYALCAQ